MATEELQRLLHLLEAVSPRSAKDLASGLGVSQPTVSRLLRAAGEDVIRVGRGPRTRYWRARRHFDGFTLPVPLYRIDPHGVAEQLGTLKGLANGGYLVDAPASHRPLVGSGDDGVYPDLPYFLSAGRPQGFLGRQIARALASGGAYPPDVLRWSGETTLRYLLHHGFDVPGDLVVGESARVRALQPPAQGVRDRAIEYPELAVQALQAGVPGSSAGGEQPKFTAFLADEAQHVIVKFSAPPTNPIALRWRDLLVAEYHAQQLLAALGIGASCRLYEFRDRLFLESVRFDRHGASGRSSAIALDAIDAEYVGLQSNWLEVAARLHDLGLLPAADLERIRWLGTFGAWIGNSDMHLGNLSLAATDADFRVLPAYDMLPMAWAPRRDELVPVSLIPPARLSQGDTWQRAGVAALAFWGAVADDERASAQFRQIAETSRRTVESQLES